MTVVGDRRALESPLTRSVAVTVPHLRQRQVVGVDEVLQWRIQDVDEISNPVIAGEDTADISQQGRQTVQACGNNSRHSKWAVSGMV